MINKMPGRITLNDGQKNNDNEEEERNIEEDSVDFVLVAIGRLDFITNATAGPHALVQMEHETLQIKSTSVNDIKLLIFI